MVTCALCGVEFEPAIPDAVAKAEADFIFEYELGEDYATVCDGCFEMMKKADPWLAAQAARFKQQN